MEQPKQLFEKFFVRATIGLLILAAVLSLYSLFQANETKYVVKETAAYTRVSNCIVAKVAKTPSVQEHVEECYQQVEKDSNIPLERFDEQINGENPKD